MRAASDHLYSASHLGDAVLRQEASAFAAGERSQLVQFLVRIAEIDVRRLYLRAGCPTMFAFCMDEYGLTQEEALRRLHAARTAREFPALFEALDAGSLCLSRVRMLATHLTPANVGELIEHAKRHSSLSDFRHFLDKFAKPDLLTDLNPLEHRTQPLESASGFETMAAGLGAATEGEMGNELDHSHGRGQVSGPPNPHADASSEGPAWVNLRIKAPRDKWEHLRNLLSHSVPSGDASKIFLRMLDATISDVERRKFAACQKPRGPRPSVLRRQRTIPAHVRRSVLDRDEGQCTFVSESGRRCSSKRLLEFDHILPVARGGESSVENLRLRCSGHNQYEAEQAFGAEFMERKRGQALQARAEKKRASATAVREDSSATAVADAPSPATGFRDDVIAGLRALGIRFSEARQIVERSGALQESTLEEGMRVALRCCGPRIGVRSG